jgi:hypothetical protein
MLGCTRLLESHVDVFEPNVALADIDGTSVLDSQLTVLEEKYV